MAHIKRRDTWPPLRGRAEDQDGLLDLTLADEILFFARLNTGNTLIEGTAQVIDPPDTDGFNWQYVWAATQTDIVGVYSCELQITWDVGSSPPKVESIPNNADNNPELTIWEDVD